MASVFCLEMIIAVGEMTLKNRRAFAIMIFVSAAKVDNKKKIAFCFEILNHISEMTLEKMCERKLLESYTCAWRNDFRKSTGTFYFKTTMFVSETTLDNKCGRFFYFEIFIEILEVVTAE